MPSPFIREALYGTRKPSPSGQVSIDRASPLSGSLASVLLFDGPRLSDVASTSRLVTRRGTIVLSRGLRGGQAKSAITASSGTQFSPCLTLSPTINAQSDITISARVQFDGTNPTAGSFGSIGSALAADDTGRMPLFVSPTTGSFRIRVPAETEFISSGNLLLASSLTGWHRVTVTVSGSAATLYVDGGQTFVGSATQALANWNLRAVLGSDITAGVQWNWQTADFFFWTRALSADEVLSHGLRPYSMLKRPLAERFNASVTPQVMSDPTDPWDTPFTSDFGPDIAAGVIAQVQGAGSLSADASSIVHANFVTASASLSAFAFLQGGPQVRGLGGTASFSGSGSLSANGASTAVHFDGKGVGSLTTNPRVARIGVGILSGSGVLLASPGARGSVRAALTGSAALTANAVQLLPFNRAQANLAGSASLSAASLVRGSGNTVLAASGSFVASPIARVAPRTNAFINGSGSLTARASIRKGRHMRPGLAVGMIPPVIVVEVDTFVPGRVSVLSTAAHGTRAHGTLSRQAPSQLENTSVIRASDVGYRTAPTDQNGPISYPPLLNDAYQIDALMTLEPNRTAASAAWGAITLANARGTFDGLIGVQNSDGRGVRISAAKKVWDFERQYLKDPPFSAMTSFFNGLAMPWSLTDQGLQIPLRDASYYLEKPLQQDLYGGSGNLDGTPDLTGKPKPICRGGTIASPIQNVTAILVDPLNRIYQYTDGPGQVIELYEGGAHAVAGQGGISFVGDTTNLYAGSTPFGSYRTDNSRGLFQLGSLPVNQITVDVIGLFPIAGALSNPFDICHRLITEDMALPASMIDDVSFNSASAATPSYVGGVYFGSDQAWSCVQAIDSILTSLGANIIPTRDGRLRMLVLRAIADAEPIAATYDTSSIISLSRTALPTTLDPPPYRFRVGYSHNYTVQTTGLNTSLATADHQQFVASPDRFATFVNIALLTAYRRPNDFDPMPGPLLTQANAQSVANALGALWSIPRRLYSVTLPRRLYGREIGDVVQLRYPIERLANGMKGRVVGYSLRAQDSVVVYQVLI